MIYLGVECIGKRNNLLQAKATYLIVVTEETTEALRYTANHFHMER